MTKLEELAARTLARDAAQPAIEFQGQWLTWGDMRVVAERIARLIAASGNRRRQSVRTPQPPDSLPPCSD